MADKKFADLPSQLDKISRMIQRTTIDATLAYGAELTRQLIADTPAKTGNLRGNWHLNPDGILPPYQRRPTGTAGQAFLQALSDVHSKRPQSPDRINISNTAPYLLRRYQYANIEATAIRARAQAREKSQQVYDSAFQNFIRAGADM